MEAKEKKMRKVLAMLLSFMLLVSLALFAACDPQGGTDGGKIDGNYTEATEEEVTEAVTELDLNKLFGDTSAEDWKFGLSLNAEAEASLTMTVEEEVYTTTATGTATYAFLAQAGTEAAAGAVLPFDMKGEGEAKANVEYKIPTYANANAPVTESATTESATSEESAAVEVQEGKIEASVKVYNDSEYVYLAPSATMDGEEEQTTHEYVSISDILYGLGLGGASVMSADAGNGETQTAENPLAQGIAMLKQLGCKFAIDASEGLKIRITADKAAIDSIITMVLAEAQAPAEITAAAFAVTEDAAVEIYLSVDENGRFAGLAVNVNGGFTMPQKITEEPSDMVIEVSAEISLVFDDTVNVTLEGLNKEEYAFPPPTEPSEN